MEVPTPSLRAGTQSTIAMKPRDLCPSSLIDDDWPEIVVVMLPARRRWARAALILAIGAIAAETVAKHHAGDAMMSMAKATQNVNDAKRSAALGMHAPVESKLAAANDLTETALRSAHRSSKWSVGGLSLFVLALACFGRSRYRRERSSSVPFSILAIAYILWLLLLV